MTAPTTSPFFHKPCRQLATGLVLLASIGLTACGTTPTETGQTAQGPERPATGPGSGFWQALAPHCGQAFRGELVASRPGDDGFRERDVVVELRHCEDSRMLMPLHVGDDRSRTWVLERHPWGVTLKHQHRDQDGSVQDTHYYGGLARPPADGNQLKFPVDDETLAMLPGSVGGVWTMEVEDGRLYYQVRRKGSDEVFRLAFDLSEAIDNPPEPWGWEHIR
ncbi:hypothetical protein VCB98_00745 [Gammaproteobacteria bacterium AB-CW1]|uniref:Lipoprotein n=1 Tax=Natronospira elongata TaxID=3110268 RepID=A0AAP6MJA6_9GAMM|nr:hypothetical protein [Gammaproteobacteria bacterium AB-CW1]